MTNKYVIVFIHLVSTVNDKNIKTVVTQEVHFVNDLHAKMLVNINIMSSEQINIIMLKRQVIINLCKNTVILIEVCSQSCTCCTIHIKFNLIISSHTEQSISIHYIQHLSKQDFLFESEESNLALFAHKIDLSLFVILTQNETNYTISIQHNQHLSYLTELNYERCYYVAADETIRNLVI